MSATPSIFKPMFQQLCDEFARRHTGIAVDLTVTARGQEDQLQSTLRQSLIGDVPDVSFQGFQFLRVLQHRGIAVPLNAFIDGDPDWTAAAYGPTLTETASVGDSVIGLGAAISVPLIYYNADRLTNVLGSQPMPRTWDGVLTLLERLAASRAPRFVPGYLRHAPSNWVYTVIVESQGGSLMSPDERLLTLDAPEGRRALEIFHTFARTGQAQTNLGREQARQAFTAGFIGILIDSSSSLAMFEKQIGNRFTLGTAALPVASNGRLPISGVASVMLTREPARQAAAWRFMKFVAGTAGQTTVGRMTGYSPANARVIHSAEGLRDYYRARPQTQPILDSLPFISRLRTFPGDQSGKIDDLIYEQLAAVLSLSKTPAAALAAMKQEVSALLPTAAG